MTQKPQMDRDLLIRLIVDCFRRGVLHYGCWFREVEYQLGIDKAVEIEKIAGDRSIDIQMKRLSKALGFELKDGMPAALHQLSDEKLSDLLDAVSANWLANDGVWFQAVEQSVSMFDAKRCNDTCWSRFSPYEAYRIRQLMGLPEQGGLKALETALAYRLYARINEWDVQWEGDDTLVFRMVDCRVQSARNRKGMEDYPCKSAGVVEYRTFASAIDPRIQTECIGCPPDPHPRDWYCAWRFTLPRKGE